MDSLDSLEPLRAEVIAAEAALGEVEARADEAARQLQRDVECARTRVARALSAYRSAEEYVTRHASARLQPLRGAGDDAPADRPDVEREVGHPGSGDRATHRTAQHALKGVGEAGLQHLLQVVAQETAKQRRRLAVVAAGLVAVIVTAMLQAPLWPHAPSLPWLLGCVIPPLVMLGRPSRLQQRALAALAGIDDVRVCGPLVEAIATGDPAVRDPAIRAVTPLLSRIRASDTEVFSQPQMDSLLRCLAEVRDYEFALAALAALEQVGDERALEPVRRLEGDTGRSPRVRAAAHECLAGLANQALRGWPGRTLLRPATQPGESPAVLLRPAQGTESDPETLLRAADGLVE